MNYGIDSFDIRWCKLGCSVLALLIYCLYGIPQDMERSYKERAVFFFHERTFFATKQTASLMNIELGVDGSKRDHLGLGAAEHHRMGAAGLEIGGTSCRLCEITADVQRARSQAARVGFAGIGMEIADHNHLVVGTDHLQAAGRAVPDLLSRTVGCGCLEPVVSKDRQTALVQ